MRPEEKQLLISRLPWFALALFLVFFAYGELHELEQKVKQQELSLENSSAPLSGLKEDLNRSKTNLEVQKKALEAYKELYDQIPTAEHTHLIIRSLERLAREASVNIEEVSMREQPPRKDESFSRLSMQVRLRAKYGQFREFITALESTVEPQMAGLHYLIKRVEMTTASSKLLATLNLQVRLKAKGL